MIPSVEGVTKALSSARAQGRTVGLVPTMGALHAGHMALVERASRDRDVVAVTIFVNPLQFGPGEDLEEYPRDIDADLAKLERVGVDVAFVPSVAEMYPRGVSTTVRVGRIGEILEGASRPSHFEGVATVVAKLFAMAGPCHAYFGEKDYQQLVVLRRLAADLCFPVEVVACPTVREKDGLAMSSRNARLGAAERASATVLYRSLLAGRAAVASGETRPSRVAGEIASVVRAEPRARLDYAEVVDASDLSVPHDLTGRDLRLLVAAEMGGVRLIDNIPVSVAGAALPGGDAPRFTSDSRDPERVEHHGRESAEHHGREWAQHGRATL